MRRSEGRVGVFLGAEVAIAQLDLQCFVTKTTKMCYDRGSWLGDNQGTVVLVSNQNTI